VSVFSERIRTRLRVWWGKPNKWRNRESYHRLFHQLKEHYVLRSKDDPEELWHCCELWQRTLSNKWNAREFAQRFGFQVPALYWRGRRIGALPPDSLPAHFVIRPTWGTTRRGVHIIAHDQDLLHERMYFKQELVAEVQREQGWVARHPILVEEFVKTEAGDYVLPIEYKCHTFGATVGAIEVIQRAGHRGRNRYYTPSWELFEDRMNTHLPPGEYTEPPRCLDEILECAKRLGIAYGTYVRIDCYATDKGCVFGEFASAPADGQHFTAFADEYFGTLWDTVFPDRT
jgi:hypothetical protein